MSGRPDPRLRLARASVIGVFSVNGFLMGTWLVRIPAVQQGLGLGEGLLGLALLGSAVGALLAMPSVGALVSRAGSRRVVGATALALCFAVVLPAVSPNLVVLFVAIALLGAANGGLDVSMNSQAVAVEKGYGRPIMSSFHAAWSFGGLAAAAVGGLVASLGIGPLPHFAAVGALSLVAFLLAYRNLMPPGADAAEDGAPAFARPTGALLGLGILSFCVLLGEGAMGDWSAVYLDTTLDTGPGFAALGYGAFSLAMALGRLFGDGLTQKLGAARLVRACGLLAAVGLGAALALGNPLFALVGFACAGAGFSIVFPLALSAAGRAEGVSSGPALAAVATAAYTGFLVGPPTIGFVAELTGLGAALYLVVGLSIAVVFLGGAVATGSGKAR